MKRGVVVKLVLIRHGQSELNLKNIFAGWIDVDLSPFGSEEARLAGVKLHDLAYDFDHIYTSYLKRAIHTADIIMEVMDRTWLPVTKAWQLNERHYGALQGLNKEVTAQRYSKEQVHLWRRSYKTMPPLLKEDDIHNPALQRMYESVGPKQLPLGESLEMTVRRVAPYFEEVIKKDMLQGKRILIVAHGNSIRGLLKLLQNLSDTEIVNVEIPTGIPLVLEFKEPFELIDSYYL